MRVLRIHSWDGKELGGGEAYVRTVSRMLSALGHEQHIIALTSTPTDVFGEMGTNIVVGDLDMARSMSDSMGSSVVQRALDKAVNEFKPEIIHLHHFEAAFASVGRFLSTSTVPLLFTAHDAELVCPISTLVLPDGRVCPGGVKPRCGFTGCKVGFGLPYNLWQNSMFNSLVKPHVKGYLCPSKALAGYLSTNGYRPAINLPSFAHIPETLATESAIVPPAGGTHIGFLGRVEPNKGLDTLFSALAILYKEGHRVPLDIAGGGGGTDYFKQLARDMGLSDNITWSGWVAGKAKEAWFARQRILVVPSKPFENFPLVALEALVRRIPVVATDAGGAKDIVRDGETGLLVPHSDPVRLAAAIRRLLTDGALAENLADTGRKVVLSEFTPEIHVSRLISIYQKVLAGKDLGTLGVHAKG